MITNDYPTCPKCHYKRNQYDSLTHKALCPACGIIYEKWKAQQAIKQQIPEPEEFQDEQTTMSVYESIKDLLFAAPYSVDSMTFWGRVITFIAFFFWGWSFIFGGIDWLSIGGSFLHNANLPFHEFGHVLFSPFGRFWMFLGGSLFQILLPLILLAVFLLKHRDVFAATIMLWWCGQNFIDISPYIADAQFRALPLISGLGKEAHDWGNLLSMTNNLQNTDFFAQTSFNIGSFLIILSYLWGAYSLWQQKKVMS